jgi:glyoxylase-like metal-dependent hydrolase (beta-lactamase superfamily II)
VVRAAIAWFRVPTRVYRIAGSKDRMEHITRRHVVMTALGALGSLVLPRHGDAQSPGVTPLTDRLSLLTTGGTNVLALETEGGAVMVDSGTLERTPQLMGSLKQVSGGRVATVFNTHYHAANTGANEVLGLSGATIVSHENTFLWMSTPVWVPAEDRYRPPRPRKGLPNKTFRVDGSMMAGAERIDYGYLIEAHTSGDIYVFFRDANVLAVGDVVAPARDPELDYFTGAWIGGRVDAMDRLLTLSNDRTRIVPGFGPVMTRAELQTERDMMKTIYDRVVDRVREGAYVEDMLKGGVMNGLPRTWKDPQAFLSDVHKGLWAHHNKLSPNVV